MYTKIIIFPLLITFSESAFSGLSYPNTPLRRVMPLMMQASTNFAGAIKQGLYGMRVEVPLSIKGDSFVTAKMQEDNGSMNVTNIKFTNINSCKILKADANLFTLSSRITIICNTISAKGTYKIPEQIDQTLKMKLTTVKINMNFDLKLEKDIFVIEKATVKVNYTKGSVKGRNLTQDKDALFSSLYKDVIEKKLIFYFKQGVGDILQDSLRSISITESLQNDYYAISTLKSSNRALSKMVNSIVDQQQEKFLKTKCRNGYYPVTNMNLTFSEKFLLIPYKGRIRLTDGYIGNIKTFRKIGTLALFGSPGESRFVILVKIHVGKAICEFDHMHTTLWGIRFIYLGGVMASINSINAEVAIDVSLDMFGFVAEVNEVVLYIPNMGQMKSQIRSLGALLGLMASFMQALVTNLFHSIFVWVFERKIEIMLNEILVGSKIHLMA